MIVLLAFAARGQQVGCYDRFMEAGQTAIDAADYTAAIQYFEAARQCVDITLDQDSIAQQTYVDAYDKWTSSLNSAIAEARDQRAKAFNARDSMNIALDSAEAARIRAIEAKRIAERRANEANARRLALESSESLEDGDPAKALSLSLEALKYDSTSALVYRAFGNAVFHTQSKYLPSVDDGIIAVHFNGQSEAYASRSPGVMSQYVEGDTILAEDGTLAYDVACSSPMTNPVFAAGRHVIRLDRSGRHDTLWTAPTVITRLETADSSFMIAACRDNVMYAWDDIAARSDNGKWRGMLEPGKSFAGHSGPIEQITISHDGTRLLSRSLDKTVRLWDMSGVAIVVVEHATFVIDACFSDDGQNLVSVTSSGRLVKTSGVDGSGIFDIQAHDGAVTSLAVGKKYICITAGLDGTVKLWDLQGEQIADAFS